MTGQIAIYWGDLHPVKIAEIVTEFGQDYVDSIDKTKPIAVVEVDHVKK